MKLSGNRKLDSKNWSGVEVNLLTVLFICLCLLLPQPALAAWSNDPIAVAAGANAERRPQVVYDGSGGYYVAWQENSGGGIFAQHYSAQGDASWASPAQLSTSGDSYLQQESTADGSGGLLVAWSEDDDYIRVQRVHANGTVAWTAGGVPVIDSGEPWIAADGTGGAIVMSYDGGLVNRVAADGSLPWADADSAIAFSVSWSATKIVSDGNGGAVLLWTESNEFSGVAVQKIDNAGNFIWNGGDPLQLTLDGASYSCPRLIPQGGGVIVTWYESDEIRAQKIDAAGAIQWAAGGAVVASGQSPSDLGLASDGAGGAFITWNEGGSSVNAQYIDTTGAVVWADVVAMTTDTNLDDIAQHPTYTASDGQGGFITAWSNSNEGIMAQRCNAAGELQCTAAGALVATGTDIYYGPKLTSNGQGGAVMVWVDQRVGTDTDIMMQGVDASGISGNPGFTPTNDGKSGGGGGSGGGCFLDTLIRP